MPKLLSYLPQHNQENPPLQIPKTIQSKGRKTAGAGTDHESLPFDMHQLISLIVDKGELFEIKHYWAANLSSIDRLVERWQESLPTILEIKAAA